MQHDCQYVCNCHEIEWEFLNTFAVVYDVRQQSNRLDICLRTNDKEKFSSRFYSWTLTLYRPNSLYFQKHRVSTKELHFLIYRPCRKNSACLEFHSHVSRQKTSQSYLSNNPRPCCYAPPPDATSFKNGFPKPELQVCSADTEESVTAVQHAIHTISHGTTQPSEIIHDISLHDDKVCVWCAISEGRITEPATWDIELMLSGAWRIPYAHCFLR